MAKAKIEARAVVSGLELIVNADQLGKRIDRATRIGALLDKELHVLACSALEHVKAYGDARPLDKLIKGMPAVVRRNAFTAWALHYAGGRLELVTEGKGKERVDSLRTVKGVSAKQVDVDNAVLTPATTFKAKEGAAFEMPDLVKLLDMVIGKARKAVETATKEKRDMGAFDMELLAQLEELRKARPANNVAV
jgi:hypothetical protein